MLTVDPRDLVAYLNAIGPVDVWTSNGHWLRDWQSEEPTRVLDKSDSPLGPIQLEEYAQRRSEADALQRRTLDGTAAVAVAQRGRSLGHIFFAVRDGALAWSVEPATVITASFSVDLATLLDPLSGSLRLSTIASGGDIDFATALQKWASSKTVQAALLTAVSN